MDLDWVVRATRAVSAVVCFRSLPVLFWAFFATDVRLGTRAGLALACGIPIAIAQRFGLFGVAWLATAYVYYALIAASLPGASRMLRDGKLTRDAAFILCTGVFLVLPSILLPVSETALVLVIGWDLVLSSYSYVVETSKAPEEGTLRECLFFLLVNPALVFRRQGHRVANQKLDLHGGARMLMGMAVLFAAFVITPLASASFQDRFESRPGRVLASVAVASLLFLLEYARHSGLASLQIGLMRQLGYVIPERYELPILAKDPLDFWRRWNTYVGNWMLHYVFWPLSFKLAREHRTLRSRYAQPIALVVTFAVVGFIHDEHWYLKTLDGHFRGLAAFSASGVLVTVCAGLAAAVRNAQWSCPTWLSSLAGRGVLWTVTVGLFTWWLR